jgi:hypothetical protein
MNYLNLSTQMMGEDIAARADSIEVGVWVRLTLYSIDQENGGVIAGCRHWKEREWIAVCRVTAAEVCISSALWSWQGDDLHLWNYPADKQAVVKQRREAGKRGGSAKTLAKAEAAKINGAKNNHPSTTQANTQANDEDYLGEAKQTPKQNPSTSQANTQRKQKEKQNGKQKENSKHSLSSASADAESSESLPAYDERERDWEKVWQAFPKRIDESRARREFFDSDANPDEIIASLALWSVSDEWTRDSGRWIPHPAKWLERAGWTEQPTQITRKEKEPVRCTL